MKSFGLLSNVLVLASYIQLKSSFAVEENKLIRRSQHQSAPLGAQCHHACDCDGYPDKPVCCEKRGSSPHKICHRCCLQHNKMCYNDKECCSQNCDNGVCGAGKCPDCYVGLCPILFPGDYIPAPNSRGPPFAPFPYYVKPRKTGPLRVVKFCPLDKINLQKPEGDGKQISKEDDQALSSLNLPPNVDVPVLMYVVKGMCEKDKEWRVIQGGTLMKHWDKDCFKIRIIDYSQLQYPHHHVDYTKYHVVFFWKWGKTIWPLWRPPLVLNSELLMYAKCNEAWKYQLHGHK